MIMANSPALLTTAADALASAVTQKGDWPADLAESAPRWADLMKQLGEIARWVTQGAVVVRDDAAQLPPNQGRPLAAKAAELIGALEATTSGRPEVDHRWRAMAATFTRAEVPGTGHGRPTLVAGVVHEAAQAVRKAANQRLAAGDTVAVLHAASTVCEAMCGLVGRIAVAVEQRDTDYPALAGISRSLQRGIHNAYRDAGEQFTAAALACEQIMTRWPGRWPDSV